LTIAIDHDHDEDHANTLHHQFCQTEFFRVFSKKKKKTNGKKILIYKKRKF